MTLFVFNSAVFAAPHLAGTELLTGKPVDIQSGEKGLAIVFLSAKCPCSMSHVPELIEVAKGNKNFQFVAVHSNMDESAETSRAYFDGLKLPFPVLTDPQAKIADDYKALKTPHVFVILKDGTTAFQGGMSDSKDCAESDRKYLRDAFEDLNAGRKLRVVNARTLGCTISRRMSAH